MPAIVTLPGDGIGPEIMAPALELLRTISEDFSFDEHAFGGAAIDAHGTALTDETLAACERADAVLLAAVGGPKWDTTDPHEPRPEQGLLGLRKGLGLFANLRPVRPVPALYDASPLKRERIEGTDLLVVRELTGGIYFGEKTRTDRSASDLCFYTVDEVDRIARVAFDAARTRRKRVASVDKANVLETSRQWREVVHLVHQAKYNDARRAARRVRRHRHREPLRGHPERRGGDDHRLDRDAALRVARRPGRPGPVRARARLRAGHRGHRIGEPAGDVPVGRAHAAPRLGLGNGGRRRRIGRGPCAGRRSSHP
jgi:isocitrate dehydrogenase